MSDFHGQHDRSILPLLLKLGLPLFFILVLAVVFLVEPVSLIEKARKLPFFQEEETGIEEKKLEKGSRDFVFDQEDLQRAAREVFEDQRRDVEQGAEEKKKLTTVYLVELASGKSLLASKVEVLEGIIILHDTKGYTIKVARSEVVTIKKSMR